MVFGLKDNKHIAFLDEMRSKYNIINWNENQNKPWNFDRPNYAKKDKRLHSSNKVLNRPNTGIHTLNPITNQYVYNREVFKTLENFQEFNNSSNQNNQIYHQNRIKSALILNNNKLN